MADIIQTGSKHRSGMQMNSEQMQHLVFQCDRI